MFPPLHGMVVFIGMSLVVLVSPVLASSELSDPEPDNAVLRDDFSTGTLDGWRVRDGEWAKKAGQAVATGKFAVMLHGMRMRRDFEAAVDVAYVHTEAFAAAGLVFRYSEQDGTGYAVGLREVEARDAR